jgi:hypothetical protein
MFLKRLGGEKLQCQGGHHCPDVLELTNGDFAVIGADITAEASGKLPAGSGCGPNERVVRIPRSVLVAARAEIPQSL